MSNSTQPIRLPFEPETVIVPAGPFLMGSDTGSDDEKPQHTVTLPEYRIGTYPVTVGEYRAFTEAGGYRERRYWTIAGWDWKEEQKQTEPYCWDDPKWTGDDRLPVVGVTWYEAVAYCKWLAEKTGKPYRLPTEAEWEKAARGTDGREFPWGNDWRDGGCNTRELWDADWDWETAIKKGHTTPVGCFSPAGDSPYGAADMAGNVSEWCLTAWRDSYSEPENNTPEGTARRVLRGGSWNASLSLARCVYRYHLDPDNWNDSRGFRVVCASLP